MKRLVALFCAALLCGSFLIASCVPVSAADELETADATAVDIGIAVLGSYVAATQLRFTGDVADTFANGITSLVSDWVEASAVAESADDWLANLGNATQMTSPGTLQLQGAFARGCAQFVEWLTETFGLDEDGEEVVAMPGVSDTCSYNGVDFPNIDAVWTDKITYPYAVILKDERYSPFWTSLFLSPNEIVCATSYYDSYLIHDYKRFYLNGDYWEFSNNYEGRQSWASFLFKWSSADIVYDDGTVVFSASIPVPVGDVSGRLDIVREEGFANSAVDAADDDDLKIFTGLTAPTLSDLALEVPAQIAAGEFAPTVELTQAGVGTMEIQTVQPLDDSVSFTVFVSGVDFTSASYTLKYILSVDGQEVKSEVSDPFNDSEIGLHGTLYGLTPETTYDLTCVLQKDGVDTSITASTTFTTLAGSGAGEGEGEDDTPDYSGQLGDIEQGLDDVQESVDKVGTKLDGVKEAVGAVKDAVSGVKEEVASLPNKIATAILDGIKKLFVPSQEDLSQIKTDYEDMLSEKLGFVWQGFDLLTTFVSDLQTSLESGEEYAFNFPGVKLPMQGEEFVLVPETAVSLENDLMDVLRPVLGTVVSMISVIAFVNMAHDYVLAIISGVSAYQFERRKE